MLAQLPTLDQMTDILDIKPIVKMSLIGLWIVLLLLLLGVLYAIFKKLKKKEKPVKKIVEVKPLLSPRERALKDLDELDALNLLERGQYRKYYFRLSEILRHFLEAEIRIPAVDTTTEEIRPPLRSSKYLTAEEIRTVEEILVEMDLVKFAKFVPTSEQTRNLRRVLRLFIETAPSRSASSGNSSGENSSGKKAGLSSLPEGESAQEGMGGR